MNLLCPKCKKQFKKSTIRIKSQFNNLEKMDVFWDEEGEFIIQIITMNITNVVMVIYGIISFIRLTVLFVTGNVPELNLNGLIVIKFFVSFEYYVNIKRVFFHRVTYPSHLFTGYHRCS